MKNKIHLDRIKNKIGNSPLHLAASYFPEDPAKFRFSKLLKLPVILKIIKTSSPNRIHPGPTKMQKAPKIAQIFQGLIPDKAF